MSHERLASRGVAIAGALKKCNLSLDVVHTDDDRRPLERIMSREDLTRSAWFIARDGSRSASRSLAQAGNGVTIMTNVFRRSVRRGRSALVGVATLCTLAGPAIAAPCAARDEIVQKLASGYGETPQSMGLSSTGSLIVMFVSPKGTWTAVNVSAIGEACLVASGDSWTSAERTSAADLPTQ
jgi:hypothetical protein